MATVKATNGNKGNNVKASKAKATTPKATTPAKSAPKSKASNAKAPESYADILKVVSAPVDERAKLAIGRKGAKVTPRRFHIEDAKLEALRKERAENPKVIPNPHNVGAYWLFVEALKALGADKPHAFKSVKAEMKKIGSAPELKDDADKTLWTRFADKEGKGETDETCKSLDQRIHQNAEVLQRLGGFTPYGLRLLQCGQLVLKSKGMVIDILKGKDGKEVSYRLNTNSNTPTNELRRARKA